MQLKILLKSFILSTLILSNIQCQDINNKKQITNNKKDMKRRANFIDIESPIMVRLDIEKKPHKLIAKLVFANVSDEEVIIDENKLGGSYLRDHVFHLNPWYNSPNLLFKPYDFQKVSPKYIVMKPHQVIETQTELNQYYDFNEKEYDIITIGYFFRMNYLDKKHQPIMGKDVDNIEKPLSFSVISNDVKFNYNKDIKPILR